MRRGEGFAPNPNGNNQICARFHHRMLLTWWNCQTHTSSLSRFNLDSPGMQGYYSSVSAQNQTGMRFVNTRLFITMQLKTPLSLFPPARGETPRQICRESSPGTESPSPNLYPRWGEESAPRGQAHWNFLSPAAGERTKVRGAGRFMGEGYRLSQLHRCGL